MQFAHAEVQTSYTFLPIVPIIFGLSIPSEHSFIYHMLAQITFMLIKDV